VHLNMSIKTYKEANWRMWCVKGHLCPIDWTERAILDTHQSYFHRMWYNEEASYTAKDGFDEKFAEQIKKFSFIS